MANYVPKVANTSNELDEILKEEPHVILINNSDILPAIKKIVKKSKKEARSSKNWKTASKLIVAGGLLAPGVIVGLGMAAIGVFSWRSRNRELNKNLLSKYEYLDTDETAYLILIKTKGKNTFDTDSDIIDLDSLGKE